MKHTNMKQLALGAVLLFPLALASACGDDEEGGGESFDTLVECVDDHLALGEAESIAHCLVDFPDLHGGLADQAACEAFVEANGGYPDNREAACLDYFEEVGG